MTETRQEPMQVWVAVQGCYADQQVVGVYATLEAGMAAHPIPERPTSRPFWRDGWRADDETGARWSNGLDWNEAVDLSRFDVSGVQS